MYKERTVKREHHISKAHYKLTTPSTHHSKQHTCKSTVCLNFTKVFWKLTIHTPTQTINLILIPTFVMSNRLTLVVPLLISTKFLVLKPDLIQKEQFTRNKSNKACN